MGNQMTCHIGICCNFLRKPKHNDTCSKPTLIKKSTLPSIKEVVSNDLTNQTHFTKCEIVNLRTHLSAIMGIQSSDMKITKEQFQTALGLQRSSLYTDRIFDVFDSDSLGRISFDDLLRILSILCHKGTLEEKTKLSFNILDLHGRGYLIEENIVAMLKSCLEDYKCLDLGNNFGLSLTDEQIVQLVKKTFDTADYDGDGKIYFDEFKALEQLHPGIAEFLTIDITGVISRLEWHQSNLDSESSTSPEEIQLDVNVK